MPNTIIDLSHRFAMLREQNQAWKLLNAKRSPLILACAEQLFSGKQKSVTLEEAVEMLANSFETFSNDSLMEIGEKDVYKLARKEWRDWLKRGLIIEREGEVFATNALQKVIEFVKGLQDDSIMTSTASRLATVKDRLNHIAIHLDNNQQRREQQLQQQIDILTDKLHQVQSGQVEIMDEQQASESIKDIYQLSMSLRGDFRRVEDSYRQADQRLREQVIKDDYHRGDIVGNLLDTHDSLLKTAEGQVFATFNQQLQRTDELRNMQKDIRQILAHPSAVEALDNEQISEFRWLTMLLNKEAQQVSKAKERSERDVRGFLQTGLASEQHRVGELLKQIFQEALDLDWQSSKLRKSDSPLPPIAISIDKVPAISRLAIKEIKDDSSYDLELIHQDNGVTLDTIDESFWQALDGLNRQEWFQQTWQILDKHKQPLTLAELSQQLPPPPRYDLEAIAMWLELAYQQPHSTSKTLNQTSPNLAELITPSDKTVIDTEEISPSYAQNYEQISLTDEIGQHWQFNIPKVYLSLDMLEEVAEEYG